MLSEFKMQYNKLVFLMLSAIYVCSALIIAL